MSRRISSRRRDIPVPIRIFSGRQDILVPIRKIETGSKPPHLCRSGSPDPDPFGSRRSRTTEVGPMRPLAFLVGGTSLSRYPSSVGGTSLSRYEKSRPGANRLTSVGQDRLILTRSGAGAPELQRWARCAPPLAFLVGGTSLSRCIIFSGRRDIPVPIRKIETRMSLLLGCASSLKGYNFSAPI